MFRRAESAAFFGREIGLMYVHAHLRYGEAMAVLGEAEALWEALQVVNPVSVAERVANASPRQRNAYFSSSDAAFPDRYRASAEWERVREGTVAADGGWRIYSSGPGLYTHAALPRPRDPPAVRPARRRAGAAARARAGHAGEGDRRAGGAVGAVGGLIAAAKRLDGPDPAVARCHARGWGHKPCTTDAHAAR